MNGEASKVVLYPKGQVEIDGKKLNKYLVAAVVITDMELNIGNNGGEHILMGDSKGLITEGLNSLQEYEPPYPLGNIEWAILSVSELSPTNLTPISKNTQKNAR